ncbi:DUF1540 domain-containing protein [Clostridium septicum]|uniref:DUF1540 domain-containing protein n=1 Tax=Clostridium septicum TaxID=1504 RepID=A0A9N7JNT9_CLOSE|nr:DUF1540 domain-containing protein [Clostridium septicum]AYE35379.1 DUF1540 domain-containing protein [Clostridium septicum]MDU1315241.1 DUF1540 domain-containing protein [Clostridium septicum]QAS60769.1 DUF1540 domain-containing protein [Clostridium septicum]UEC19966.1 DUF1540 domain-containing protein [Clostridium septicum]USS01975.1 DUF1540 domain-containing protein [Clostridium septicum]
MQKINCDVNNCSYNKSGICFSDRIDVGGKAVDHKEDTCCGSFLDKSHYSDLTNATNEEGPCNCIVCQVENCVHNCNKLCDLSSINVAGYGAKIYTETNCNSFSNK